MRNWAHENGKSVRQRTVRQETTKYKAGTLPLNMYEGRNPGGERLQFKDGSVNILDRATEYADEYSSDSSSSSSSSDIESSQPIDELAETNMSFLRTTRSGRSISINRNILSK